MKDFADLVRSALLLLVFFTVATGLAYPAVMTGLAQATLERQADGDPDLVAQPFSGDGYFWGRLSAVAPGTAMTSSGTNRGALHPDLIPAAQARIDALRAWNPEDTRQVPIDLVTASGSGLDPHVTPAGALYQVPRVAKARGLDEATVRALVENHVEERALGILGERRVNVVRLNRALDQLAR
jgi:K+-transporting ATPase ATPase C chain